MRRRLALSLALALATGCSKSGGGGTTSADAGPTDASSDDDRGTTDASEDTDWGPTTDADGAPNDVIIDTRPPGLCDVDMPTITPQSAGVAGVLTGPNINAFVTCQFSVITGLNAFFKLEVSAYTIVELTVTAPVQTIIAIRTGCQDDASEVACGEMLPPVDLTNPGGSSDGGANDGPAAAAGDGGSALLEDAGDAPSAERGDTESTSMISSVRAGLPAGTYLVFIDTRTLTDLTSAAFTLDARVVPLTGNATCEDATLLTPQAGSVVANLDLAGPPETSCGGSKSGALFYSVEVPANNRLTVRAMPPGGGAVAWMPTLAAFASCDATTCLAHSSGAAGAVQELEWVNNGPSSRLVTLEVGTDVPMSGVQLILDASVTDLLATCSQPTPVQDGTVLLDQDPTTSSITKQSCLSGDAQAQYYVATLLPMQSVTPTLTKLDATNSAFHVAFRTSCTDSCILRSQGDSFINLSSTSQTILIEIAQPSGNVSRFDLRIAMPLPQPASR